MKTNKIDKEKIVQWLKRPTSYKIKSISYHVRLRSSRTSYRILLSVLKFLHVPELFSKQLMSRVVFDLSNKNSLLIGGNENEPYIASASDMGVGKSVYIYKRAQDSHKLKTVIDLIGTAHQRKK